MGQVEDTTVKTPYVVFFCWFP